MKKAFILCTLWCLNACIYAGEVDVWPGRREWVASFSSYGIDYKDNAAELVKTEQINEKSFKLNEAHTAFKGYSLLSDKTFEKQYYVTEKIRANGNVVLGTASVPYEYKNNQTFDIIGYSTVKGRKLTLVPTNLEDFVVLCDAKTGELYEKTGMIKNKKLIVLSQEFVPNNPKFRFEPVFTTKIEQTKPNKGYDIKFDGVRMNRMWFVYYDFADEDSGDFKEYSFPAKPGLIGINGVKIRIMSVSEEKVDYMILDA